MEYEGELQINNNATDMTFEFMCVCVLLFFLLWLVLLYLSHFFNINLLWKFMNFAASIASISFGSLILFPHENSDNYYNGKFFMTLTITNDDAYIIAILHEHEHEQNIHAHQVTHIYTYTLKYTRKHNGSAHITT